jgi:membrane-associated phospholipid phosphatase
MNIFDYISMSVGLLYLIPLGFYFYTNNIIHIKAFVGVAGTTIISETLKRVVIKNVSSRPRGASNCNLLCDDGNQSGKPGMPSSHSAQAVFFSAYYYQFTNNTLIRFFLILYAIAVMISRYIKRCHTIGQIIAGAILGLSLSFVVVRHL